MLDVEDIGVGAEPEPAKFSGWNDGFEEEEKSEDLDLGLESENFDLPELGGTEDEPWLQNPLGEENADAENIPAAPAPEDIEPVVEAENIAAEEKEPISENNAVPESFLLRAGMKRNLWRRNPKLHIRRQMTGRKRQTGLLTAEKRPMFPKQMRNRK